MKVKGNLIRARMAEIEMSLNDLSQRTNIRASTLSNSISKRKRLSERLLKLIVGAINNRIREHPEYDVEYIRVKDMVDMEPEGVIDGRQ